ncbi:MAG: sigma-70 family RNA polymerase sigma factor [Thermoleophilia bacterium]|nr:sigma-70 family RNA polymerase sigma factor [Thermoleophilia bacterium]
MAAEPRLDRPADDAALVRRVADGDADALRALYERLGRIVYAFALRHTRDASLAEECTQDAFVALWRNARSYDPARAKVSTWLLVVARNKAIELLRARERRPEEVEGVDVDAILTDEAPGPATMAERADLAQRVAEAMAELPAEQREVVTLAYFEGLTHTEIADVIGIPLGTVKGRMRLALARLRALVEEVDLHPERA